MKKFYYLAAGILTILVTIIACEKSAIGVDEVQTLSKEEVLLSKGEKVAICHWDADEGVYYWISIAPEAMDKHFAKHGDKFPETFYEDLDGDGDGNPAFSVVDCEAPDGYVDNSNDLCDNIALPYDPTGCYNFYYTDGSRNYEHHFIFNTFDGTDFTGTGDYVGGETYTITGTVSATGVLTGVQTTNRDSSRFFRFSGTVDKCGGIATIDATENTYEDDSHNDGVGLHWEFSERECEPE